MRNLEDIFFSFFFLEVERKIYLNIVIIILSFYLYIYIYIREYNKLCNNCKSYLKDISEKEISIQWWKYSIVFSNCVNC